jgi:hypothetical protein
VLYRAALDYLACTARRHSLAASCRSQHRTHVIVSLARPHGQPPDHPQASPASTPCAARCVYTL